MIDYIIGYGSIAIVVIWLSIVLIRAKLYKKTSIKNCDGNCANCQEECAEIEKKIIATSRKTEK